MTKRILSLVLSLALCVMLCGTALAQGDGVVTIWMSGDGSEVADWNSNAILNAIEEATGTDIELVFIVDGMGDQITAAAVSQDMPDIIVCQDHNAKTTLQMWVDGGIVAPVTGEVAEAAPNWVALYEENENLAELKINGEIYMVPVSWGTGNAPNAGLIHVRGDLMEKYGFETIDTYEEYTAFLQAAVDDGYIGLTIAGADMSANMLNVFLGGMGKPYSGWIKAEDGSYSHWSVQEEVPTAINYVRELVAAGLVDAGVWSCDADTQRTNYVSGKAASTIFNGGGHIGRLQNDMSLIDTTFKEILLPALDFGNGVRGYTQEDMYWGASLLGNTENCDPVEAAKVINYLISDEGYQLTAIGIEGRDFEYDANGEIVLLDARTEDGFPTEAGDTGAHVLATPIVSWVPQSWQNFQLLYGKDASYKTWFEEQFANQLMYQIPNYGRNCTSPLWTEFQSTQSELFSRYFVDALNASSLEEVQAVWAEYVNEFNANGGADATAEMSEVLAGIYAE